MKSTILLSIFIFCTQSIMGQPTPNTKPITIYGQYGSVEKIYIFKVEDTSLLTISPATYGKLRKQALYNPKEIEKLMREGKYGYEAQVYGVEEIGMIDILGSGSKGKTRGIAMITGGVIGGIIGLVVHQGKSVDDCGNDFLPFAAGCVVDRGAGFPLHSIGLGVGAGALLGGFFATPPIKININGQRDKFKKQQERLRRFSILR